MPQFKAEGSKDAFLKNAEKLGYKVDRRRVALGDMGVVQAQILQSKSDAFEKKFDDSKKEMKEYAGKGTIVIGGDVLDGHHHYRAALKAGGAKQDIATDWIYKTDKNGKEVPMTSEDKLKLWKASINTKVRKSICVLLCSWHVTGCDTRRSRSWRRCSGADSALVSKIRKG